VPPLARLRRMENRQTMTALGKGGHVVDTPEIVGHRTALTPKHS
jgi:hypothetical protein